MWNLIFRSLQLTLESRGYLHFNTGLISLAFMSYCGFNFTRSSYVTIVMLFVLSLFILFLCLSGFVLSSTLAPNTFGSKMCCSPPLRSFPALESMNKEVQRFPFSLIHQKQGVQTGLKKEKRSEFKGQSLGINPGEWLGGSWFLTKALAVPLPNERAREESQSSLDKLSVTTGWQAKAHKAPLLAHWVLDN